EDPQSAENRMQMNQDDLQNMMDRIQDLMEQGRMAEAQQALEEFQRMMENMRVTRGEGPGSPGQQALEGLGDTLRGQQSLSDQAFQDLQDRFNSGGQGRGEEGSEATEQSLAERQQELRQELKRQRDALPGVGEQGEAAGEALDRAGRA